MSSDGREWIALMRRHYLHMLSGGSLSAFDMERHIEAAEGVQAELERVKAERDSAREWARKRGHSSSCWTRIGSGFSCECGLDDVLAEEEEQG